MVIPLNEKTWKDFPAFDKDGLLEIKATKSGVDGIKLKEGENKLIPYVTRTNENNGIATFVDSSNLTFREDESGTISIGLDTQTAFYQPHNFLTGQNIHVVSSNELNEHNAQFIVQLLRDQMTAKFNWGGNGATLGRMKKLRIMLPSDDSGNPDFEYMSKYVKERERQLLERYVRYARQRIAECEFSMKGNFALKVSDREWREFVIGDLFEVFRPEARSKDDYVDGDIPFVASGAMNNGVMKCCTPKEDETLDRGNCITVSPVDGSTFYHELDFLGRGGAGSSILILRSDKLNRENGLFFARSIQHTCSKYTYGRMGNKDGIKRERILLPIDPDGNPDYTFMEEYVREREKSGNWKPTCGSLDHRILPKLEEKQWKEFTIEEIFEIRSGKRLETRNKIPGETPFIGASELSNGITGFVGNDNSSRDSNTLGVSYNGAPCIAFYHPYECIFTDDVKHLHLKNHEDNEFALLFFTAIFAKQKEKYGYGYKFNEERMRRQLIMLPVTAEGNPDYEYMEQYSRNMIMRKYERYLQYLEESKSPAIRI